LVLARVGFVIALGAGLYRDPPKRGDLAIFGVKGKMLVLAHRQSESGGET
jgi:hypothetical protein